MRQLFFMFCLIGNCSKANTRRHTIYGFGSILFLLGLICRSKKECGILWHKLVRAPLRTTLFRYRKLPLNFFEDIFSFAGARPEKTSRFDPFPKFLRNEHHAPFLPYFDTQHSVKFSLFFFLGGSCWVCEKFSLFRLSRKSS